MRSCRHLLNHGIKNRGAFILVITYAFPCAKTGLALESACYAKMDVLDTTFRSSTLLRLSSTPL